MDLCLQVFLFKSLVRAAYSALRLKAIPTNPMWLLLTFHFFWLEVMLPPNDSSLWLWNYCFLRSEPISGNTMELVGTRLRIVCSFIPGNFVRFHRKRLSSSLASWGNLCRHLRLPSRFIQKAAVPLQVEAQLWTEPSFFCSEDVGLGPKLGFQQDLIAIVARERSCWLLLWVSEYFPSIWRLRSASIGCVHLFCLKELFVHQRCLAAKPKKHLWVEETKDEYKMHT